MTKLSPQRVSQYFFLILLFLIIYLTYTVLEVFLTSILLSVILTYYFYPAYCALLRVVKNKSLASLLMILMILLILVPPTTYVILKLANEAVLAFQNANTQYGPITKEFFLRVVQAHITLGEIISQTGAQLVAFTKANAQKIISSVSNAVLQLFIFFFVMYYGFKDGPVFFDHVQQILPLKDQQKKILSRELKQMIHGVIHGQFTTALIQGILGGTALWILHLPNPIFLGFVMFLLSFLPIIGSALVWVPSSVWLFLQGQTSSGIILLAFGFLILANIDNIIRPKLIHSTTRLHPVLVFLGVLGGLRAFGFAGILLGPIVLLMLNILIRFYQEEHTHR